MSNFESLPNVKNKCNKSCHKIGGNRGLPYSPRWKGCARIMNNLIIIIIMNNLLGCKNRACVRWTHRNLARRERTAGAITGNTAARRWTGLTITRWRVAWLALPSRHRPTLAHRPAGSRRSRAAAVVVLATSTRAKIITRRRRITPSLARRQSQTISTTVARGVGRACSFGVLRLGLPSFTWSPTRFRLLKTPIFCTYTTDMKTVIFLVPYFITILHSTNQSYLINWIVK
jgi:hypothetical protein